MAQRSAQSGARRPLRVVPLFLTRSSTPTRVPKIEKDISGQA
jgi:hypothetical protein